MPREHVKIYEENNGLSIWFWIVPLLLVLAFAVFFVRHHRPRALQFAAPTANTLPDLGSVHFDTAAPTLDADGQATLDRAAEAMRGNPNVGLRLEGYPDQPGVSLHNDLLTRKRTQTVAHALETRGIDPARLVVAPFPDPTPATTDPDPAKAPDTRRIQLYLK